MLKFPRFSIKPSPRWVLLLKYLICSGVIIAVTAIGFLVWYKQQTILQFQIGSPITSYPVFQDHKIFFGTKDGYIYALDDLSFHELWEFRAHDLSPHQVTIDNGVVYVSDFDGKIYALNEETGAEQWQFLIPDYIQPDTPVAVSGQLAYFGDRRGVLYALDKKTGRVQWKFHTKGIDTSVLVPDQTIIHFGLLRVDDHTVYINSSDGHFYAVDKLSGKQQWQLSPYQFLYEIPTVDDHFVYIRSADQVLTVVDKVTGQVAWTRKMGVIDQERVILTPDGVYIKDQFGNLSKLRKDNGQVIWIYKSDEYIQNDPLIEGGLVFMSARVSGGAGRYIVLRADSGEVVWKRSADGIFTRGIRIEDPKNHDVTLYLGNTNGEFTALDGQTGYQEWQLRTMGDVLKDPFVGEKRLYLPSVLTGDQAQIFALRRGDGQVKWRLTGTDIDPDTVAIQHDQVFFLSKNRDSIYFVRKYQLQKTIDLDHIKLVWPDHDQNHNQVRHVVQGFLGWLTLPLERLLVMTHQSQLIHFQLGSPSVEVGDIYEATITSTEAMYHSPVNDVTIEATVVGPDGQHVNVPGFYAEKNTWKLRYLFAKPGKWQLSLSFHSPLLSETRTQTIQVNPSNFAGFMRIDKENVNRFVLDNGQLFTPIGIQDAIQDFNFNGDYFDQWAVSGDLHSQDKTEHFVPLDTYLQTYGPNGAGFNLFRWTVDNASFPLWQDFQPNGNYAVPREGHFGDVLVQSLRAHGFHVWMSIFGFTPPFAAHHQIQVPQNRATLTKYLDYVIGRYGPYVDVWELANEARPDDDWVIFVAQYMHDHDPYHHPVTINWERWDLKQIDITSVHWYQTEPDSDADTSIVNKIDTVKKWGKPVVFSEQGNRGANWDETSALRMRVRSWTAFFNEGTLIFWNYSRGMYYKDENANIYLGPEEQQYIRHLQDFTQDLPPDLSLAHFDLDNTQVRGYGLSSVHTMLGYFYHYSDQHVTTQSAVQFTVPRKAVVTWVDPATGQQVGTEQISAGEANIETPAFTTDIAMKVEWDK